jgi:site-specific recombinase XerD
MEFPLIEDKSARTIKGYAYNINLFLEWLKERGKTLFDISDIEIARFLQIKQKEG